MKRLVAAGARRIYQITRAFRAGEQRPPPPARVHHRRVVPGRRAAGGHRRRLRGPGARGRGGGGRGCPSRAGPLARSTQPFERTTVRDAVRPARRHRARRGRAGRRCWRPRPPRRGWPWDRPTAWDDVFFQVFLDRVEPHLGRGRPTFVFDWPAPLAALARRKPDDPRLAERFELYAGGLELANAFGELTDPVEQRARFLAEAERAPARGARRSTPSTRSCWRRWPTCRPPAGSPWASTGWSCSCWALPTSGEVIAFPDDGDLTPRTVRSTAAGVRGMAPAGWRRLTRDRPSAMRFRP